MNAGSDSLTELCESARQLLRMDRAGIQLLDARARRLEMLAHAGDMPADPPRYYDVDGMPNVRRCLDGGRVMFAEDVEALDGPRTRTCWPTSACAR
jgi:hypothetical protein